MPAASARATTCSGAQVVARSVSVTGRSHQRIAHRTADHADLFSILVQKREDPA
jgi:hypothetical protein